MILLTFSLAVRMSADRSDTILKHGDALAQGNKSPSIIRPWHFPRWHRFFPPTASVLYFILVELHLSVSSLFHLSLSPSPSSFTLSPSLARLLEWCHLIWGENVATDPLRRTSSVLEWALCFSRCQTAASRTQSSSSSHLSGPVPTLLVLGGEKIIPSIRPLHCGVMY